MFISMINLFNWLSIILKDRIKVGTNLKYLYEFMIIIWEPANRPTQILS